MKKSRLIRCFLLVIIIFLLIGINTNTISKANDDVIIDYDSNYSYEYEKWLKLSDEEKINCIMPSMHTINLDINDYEAKSSEITSTEQFPSKYSSQDLGIIVRDQGDTDSCWAISAVEMFEIAYAKLNNNDNIIQYSSRHINYSCSKYFTDYTEVEDVFNRTVGDGGYYEYAMAYFTSGNGPILEDDMPFVDTKELISISEIQNKTVQAQLEDYTEYPQIYKTYDSNNEVTYSNGAGLTYTEEQIEEFRKIIKEQIMTYGAVAAYTRTITSSSDTNNYFSNENGSLYGNSYFCNNTELTINHAICIIRLG